MTADEMRAIVARADAAAGPPTAAQADRAALLDHLREMQRRQRTLVDCPYCGAECGTACNGDCPAIAQEVLR